MPSEETTRVLQLLLTSTEQVDCRIVTITLTVENHASCNSSFFDDFQRFEEGNTSQILPLPLMNNMSEITSKNLMTFLEGFKTSMEEKIECSQETLEEKIDGRFNVIGGED